MDLLHTNAPLPGAEFDRLYAMMEEAFPENEFRDWEGQRALLSRPEYHLWRYMPGGRLAARMALWSLDGFWFLEHFAVDGSLRGGGIGRQMFEQVAGELGGALVLEVEPPETEIARRRIRFYERLGCVVNRYPYQQMPLRAGDSPTPLVLMTRPAPIDEQTFAAYRRALYTHVYGIENPAE